MYCPTLSTDIVTTGRCLFSISTSHYRWHLPGPVRSVPVLTEAEPTEKSVNTPFLPLWLRRIFFLRKIRLSRVTCNFSNVLSFSPEEGLALSKLTNPMPPRARCFFFQKGITQAYVTSHLNFLPAVHAVPVVAEAVLIPTRCVNPCSRVVAVCTVPVVAEAVLTPTRCVDPCSRVVAVCAVPVVSEAESPQHAIPAEGKPRVPTPHRVLHLQTRV